MSMLFVHFVLPSWFLHGFHLFYLHDLLHSHKVFSYVCVILRHGGSWARKLRRQFFNKCSSCHKNPVIMKKPPCSRFQKHDGIVSSLQFLYYVRQIKFHRCIFYTSFIFFCQELDGVNYYLSIYLLIYRFLSLKLVLLFPASAPVF